MKLMKIRMHHLQLFVLFFVTCSLLIQLPSEAFADSNSSGSVKSTAVINDSTENGPVLDDNDRFGWSVANIGDLDVDGVDDIVAGATYDGTGGNKKGAVHIMFMESDGSVKSTAVINDSTENGPDLTGGDQFGYSVENLGDLDGDGVNDLAVGAINDDEGSGNNRGAIHIIFMNTDGSVDSIVEINSSTTNGPSLAASDNFGTSIANIGDLNNDGVNDLAVGALGDDGGGTNRGAVHIMYMNTDGSVDSTVEINDSTENGPDLNSNDAFGESVENLGDLDGDGVNDLAVGASKDNANGNNDGTIYIIYMNTDGSVKSTVEINAGTTNGPAVSATERFGKSIAEIGDFDSNCINDLAVGAYNADDPGNNRGEVHIIFMEDENPDVDCVTSSSVSTSGTSSTCSRHVILGNCGTIAINNDEYQIINTWTNVPTTEVLVGQPVTVTLSTTNDPTYTKIHFASVHTEVFSIPANFDQTAHIDYSIMSDSYSVTKAKLFQVAAATHRIAQDPDVKNLEMFEVVFTMIFAKPMDTSHVVVETKNKHGIPATLYLLDALKVNENLAQALTLEEKSKFSIIDPEPEMDPQPEMEMDPEPKQTKKEKSKRQRR